MFKVFKVFKVLKVLKVLRMFMADNQTKDNLLGVTIVLAKTGVIVGSLGSLGSLGKLCNPCNSGNPFSLCTSHEIQEVLSSKFQRSASPLARSKLEMKKYL